MQHRDFYLINTGKQLSLPKCLHRVITHERHQQRRPNSHQTTSAPGHIIVLHISDWGSCTPPPPPPPRLFPHYRTVPPCFVSLVRPGCAVRSRLIGFRGPVQKTGRKRPTEYDSSSSFVPAPSCDTGVNTLKYANKTLTILK